MQQISTAVCEYRKAQKELLVPHHAISGGFPNELEVVSAHTGKVALFVVDVQAGIENEFWDGEQCEYVPAEPLPNVVRLTIYNC